MAIINAQGQGLAPLIQALQQRQQMDVAAQQLDLQERDVKVRERDAKLRAEQQQFDATLRRAQQQGMAVAAQLFTQGLGSESIPQRMDPSVTPFALEALQQFQQTGAQTSLTGAQARGAGVAADVATATAPAQIEAARLEPEALRAQLASTRAGTENLEARTRGQQLANEYAAAQNALGPEFSQRLSQARGLFETGTVTWGEARNTAGLPQVEGGPDDSTVFVNPTGTQQNAEALKNQGFARMMQISDGIINTLEADGVRLSILPALQRQTQSAGFDAAVNLLASPEQQRLVNAQRMFGDAYRFSLSGQQSSDREALRMMNSISSQVGDDDATLAQKRVLRETMRQVTAMKAGGAITSVQGAQMGLRAAQNTGNAETIDLFKSILDQAILFEGNAATRPPSSAPTDGASLSDSLDEERLNALLGLN